MRRALVVVVVLLITSMRLGFAACPSTPGVVTYTPIKHHPQIGVGVADADYALAFCQWAENDESQRFQVGTFSARPTATSLTLTKQYVVTDCNTTSCTAGSGSTKCLTYINDSTAWTVAGCFGASTADVSSSVGSAVDNQIARFDGTTGKLIQNSTCTISDAGVLGGTCALPNDFVTPNNVKSTGQSAGLVPSIVNGTTWAWASVGGGGGTCTDVCATLNCNGTTSDTSGLQTYIDNANAAGGGSLCITGGKTIALATTVTLKSKVEIRCEGGAGFKQTGSTVPLSSTTTADDWTIDGCLIDANGTVGVSMVSVTGGTTAGSRWKFTNNTVRGIGTSSNAGFQIVRLDCTASATTTGTGGCEISGNIIWGSNTPATNDTCLAVSASGGEVFSVSAMPVVHNQLHNCGSTGFECITRELDFSHNSIFNASKFGAKFAGGCAQSTVIGNAMSIAGGGQSLYFADGHNLFVAYNEIQATSGVAAILCVGSAGLSNGCVRNRWSNNYAPSGIWIRAQGACASGCSAGVGTACSRDADCGTGCSGDPCTNYPRSDNNTIDHNILTAGSAPTPVVWVENGLNTVIDHNTSSGPTTTGDKDFIRLTQLDANADGPAFIDHNFLESMTGTGTQRAIELDAPETNSTGAVDGIRIDNNIAKGADTGLNVESAVASGSIYLNGNDFTAATTPIAGLPGTLTMLGPVKLGGLNFDMGPSNAISTSDEWVFRLTPFPAAITRIECESYGGTSYTIVLCVGEDTGDDTCASAYTTAALVCTTTGGTACASGCDTTLTNMVVGARQKVTIEVTATSTPPQKGEIYIEGARL